MSARRFLVVASMILSGFAAHAQVPDFSNDIVLTETLACPGCETTEQFRNAAIEECLTGYRSATGGIGNLVIWSPGEYAPGILPGTTEWAGANDPCVYQMEIRGNLWQGSKVFLQVCNAANECRIVFHQYNLECLGAESDIGIPPVVVGASFCAPIGLEGLCTTVRDPNLNETSSCIVGITQRGALPGTIPPQPPAPAPPAPNPPHGQEGHHHVPQCDPGIVWDFN